MAKTILIVDDDPAQRRLLQAAVERNGFHTRTAENGVQAVVQVDSHQDIDIVLLDLVMPGMSGQEALKEIRAPLRIEAHLAPEDPRRGDLEHRALSKLRRVMPKLQVRYVFSTTIGLFEQTAPHYGEIWYELGARRTVSRVTTEGGRDFVPPEERIAVFDNDGTLWCEQPMYVQLAFALDRVKALAPGHPEWKDTEPFKSALAGDFKGLAATGESIRPSFRIFATVRSALCRRAVAATYGFQRKYISFAPMIDARQTFACAE